LQRLLLPLQRLLLLVGDSYARACLLCDWVGLSLGPLMLMVENFAMTLAFVCFVSMVVRILAQKVNGDVTSVGGITLPNATQQDV